MRAVIVAERRTQTELTDVAMPESSSRCWICGADGTSQEHRIKKSDLEMVFGAPSQKVPLYFHDGKKKAKPVGSLNSKILKISPCICHHCNTTRTQPHDRAWERLSGYFKGRTPQIAPGAVVRANQAFPYDTCRKMVNVHLFFVKLFGCYIMAGDIPVDINGFANAIMNRKAHPNVYLKFGSGSPKKGMKIAGMSDIHILQRISNGSAALAHWFYDLHHLRVLVMYAEDDLSPEGLLGAWHPKMGTNRLVIADYPYIDPESDDAEQES